MNLPKLAFSAGDPNSDLWVDELAWGVRMRLTNDPLTDQAFPVWSPDGSRILFGALQGKARPGINQKPSDGAGGEELQMMAGEVEPRGNSFQARKALPLFRAAVAPIPYPYDVTPDGRFVINIVNNASAPLTLVVNWTARLGNKP